MIIYILYFVFTLALFFSALRIRQGFNEDNNTPYAILIFSFCLVFLCSIGV